MITAILLFISLILNLGFILQAFNMGEDIMYKPFKTMTKMEKVAAIIMFPSGCLVGIVFLIILLVTRADI